ncbi:MAG TPA: DUF5916 domain-containing protein [Longimicrobiales bacterium]|nr:DUF5916 domain-containing protein [Longimicrobiales bacterium]
MRARNSRTRAAAAAAALLALLPLSLTAQAPASGERPRPVVAATRAVGSIHVDGRLDEASWAAAQVVSEFTQVDPEEGQPVSERTEARVLYDDEAIYIGVRLHDRQRPTMRLGRRDMDLMDSDWLGVVIDSYHDHRTAFSMDLNPAGVQRDAVKTMVNGAEQDDNSWDAVWDARATVDEGGWTAEYRVPFSQLRFGNAPEQTWGIQLERVIGRRREYAVLSFTPKSEPGGIPTYAHLTGLRDIEPGHRLEVLPYAVARAERVDPGANPFRTDSEVFGSGGVDLLYRVTSDFALNASINPDFGQVEADPAVVNLSVYETFFEEKRPFFVEGGEIFNFGRNTSGGQLFYTRRIGRAPQLGAPTPASDAPDVTTILGAAKLSGKTASGWSLGIIEAVTDREDARFLAPGGGEEAYGVEPLTNYLVARARRDANQGRASLGAMLTAVNRDLATDPMKAVLRSSAYSGGVDVRLESPSRIWVVSGSAAFSRVSGTPEAVVRVQRAGNHFFQRPDADHLAVDSSATSLGGYSIGASVARQGGTHWRGNLAVAATSPGFEVNDLGFQTRTDRRDVQAGLTYVQNTPGSFLRNYSITGTTRLEHNFDWRRILGFSALQVNFRTLEFWGGAIQLQRQHRSLDDRNTRGGPLKERPASWNGFGHVGSDTRRRVSVFTTVFGAKDDYGSWNAGGEVLAVLRAPRWNVSVGPSFTRSYEQAQYLATVRDAGAVDTYGAYYLFAPLRQTTVAMETRLDFTFTPKLSFQLYAQPFISSGDYGRAGSLKAPETHAFVYWPGQLQNPDFNYRSLRGTAVLRWEYRPGSTLYLAWQQSREDYAQGVGDFDFGRDRQAMFRAHPDNVFVLKASWWLTP